MSLSVNILFIHKRIKSLRINSICIIIEFPGICGITIEMLQNYYHIIIIGAGPAGLMAAIESHKPSRNILILEKMPSPALKLKISGQGRWSGSA